MSYIDDYGNDIPRRRSYGNNRNYNNRGGYNNGYNNGGNRQGKKRTGCKSGVYKGDKPYVRGWNASKTYGLVSFFACEFDGTHVSESKTGRKWANWMVKVQPRMGKEFITSGLYDVASGKVIIQSMGIVMNPRTNYCGKFGKK